MKHLPLVALVALAGCSATQTAQVQTALASDPGQLFCDIQLAGGGSMVAGVVDAEASALAPGLAPAFAAIMPAVVMAAAARSPPSGRLK